jgi:5-oxoprolinase (ATP-hydrolysing) subunit A
LNIDLGELEDEPEELYGLAHLVNVACGGHAGDAGTIDRAVALAAQHGAQVGAHPSYPDREGFGRTAIAIEPAALALSLREQLGLLRARADAAATRVGHVKAHGALYHAIDRDDALASVCISSFAAVLGPIDVLGPPGGSTERASRALGLAFLGEGFADRGLLPDGSLVPRGQPGALITDPGEARAQAAALVRTRRYHTLCVHGDTENAVAIARAVRETLDLS